MSPETRTGSGTTRILIPENPDSAILDGINPRLPGAAHIPRQDLAIPVSTQKPVAPSRSAPPAAVQLQDGVYGNVALEAIDHLRIDSGTVTRAAAGECPEPHAPELFDHVAEQRI